MAAAHRASTSSARAHGSAPASAREKLVDGHSNSHSPTLPMHNGNGNGKGNGEQVKQTKGIKAAGESGRRGFHPLHFFRIAFRSSSKVSMAVNVLWPFVPAAIACRYALSLPEHSLTVFILSYIAMVPCANLIGFSGQELARKFPHVFGVLTEVTFGSVVEIILFMVLLTREQYYVIQAAILGSILATLLLCLGLCFFFGGLRRHDQTFNEAVSETGNGLLLTAGFALAIPTLFERSLIGGTESPTEEVLADKTLSISRITAVLMIIAYLVFIWFQAHSHHGIYDAIFEQDEERDADGHKDRAKDKLTFTECIISLAVAIALVTIIAISLVEQITPIVELHGVSDPFMGLILVPVVEKAAEHLTAIDEAWDNQMNFALSHVLGATLQTALFNAPLVVIVGWGMNLPMDLNFEMFDIVVLILAIITVGNFLRDQRSNYLEGFLCVIVYIAIAVAAFYYPNPTDPSAHTDGSGGGHAEGGTEAGSAHERLVKMMMM